MLANILYVVFVSFAEFSVGLQERKIFHGEERHPATQSTCDMTQRVN